nr:hypothetical protein P5640_24780 [Bacillus subtilis]
MQQLQDTLLMKLNIRLTVYLGIRININSQPAAVCSVIYID